jgi:hypothetical protein
MLSITLEGMLFGMAQTQQAAVQAASELLSELVYELLDAHSDTVALVAESADVAGWEAHVEYLCRLQRVGREALAQISATYPLH